MMNGGLSPTAARPRFGLLGRLLEAFVDIVEPVFLWSTQTKRLVVVQTGEDDLAFYRVSRARAVLLGRSGTLSDGAQRSIQRAKGGDVELRIAADSVIVTALKIPADGLAYVEQIVESRLDRITPWTPDTLLYGFDATAAPAVDGSISVDFAATSRAIASAALARLEKLGVTPARMGSAAEPVEQRLRIDLLRGAKDTARRKRRRTAAVFAVVLLAAAILAAAVSFAVQLSGAQRLSELDADLAATRNGLVARSGDGGDRDRLTALLAGKTPANARFAMIDRLATVLPDDTFLDEMDVDTDTIRIAGTSTQASNLIELLSAEPDFATAKFTAPVTRQEDGRDRFDISAVRTEPFKTVAP